MKIANIQNIVLQFDIENDDNEETIKATVENINHFLSEKFKLSQPKLLLNEKSHITIINPNDIIC